jgi:hypothetical protein
MRNFALIGEPVGDHDRPFDRTSRNQLRDYFFLIQERLYHRELFCFWFLFVDIIIYRDI